MLSPLFVSGASGTEVALAGMVPTPNGAMITGAGAHAVSDAAPAGDLPTQDSSSSGTPRAKAARVLRPGRCEQAMSPAFAETLCFAFAFCTRLLHE